MRSKIVQKRTLALMLVPCFVVLAMIVLVPLINLVVFSFYDYELSSPAGMKFIGLENYFKVAKDKIFINSIRVTAIYIIGVLATQLPAALLLVETLSHIKKGTGLIKTLIMPPMVVPGVIAGVIWRLLYNPSRGLINYFLSPFGIQHAWLADPNTTLFSLIVADFWQNTPFLILVLLAGRSTIPNELYEAARIDGANGLLLFRRITLPLLRGSLMIGILFRVIDSLKAFSHIHMMTSGGPGDVSTTINYYAYRMAFTYTDIGYSSALGFILLVLTTTLAVVMVKAFKERRLS